LTSVADATSATDGLNRQTADARYYLNTTTLNNITAPTAALSLNSKQITSLASAGTIGSSNTAATNAADVYNFVSPLPGFT